MKIPKKFFVLEMANNHMGDVNHGLKIIEQFSKITKKADKIVVHMPWGDALLETLPRFVLPGLDIESGGLIAPMPGKVIDLKVKVGSKVKKGDTLVILEAMKMEHQVKASEDGKVSKLLIKKDDQLDNGALLMIVKPK